MHEWFDELDLDPASHPVAMGTRALGSRPWLVGGHDAAAQVARRRVLLNERRGDVVVESGADAPALRVLGPLLGAGDAATSITQLSADVAEDLCLIRRIGDRWHLDTSCVCFPTRWKLADKFGLPMAAVHAPVGQYSERIESAVDRLFDRLTDRPVWRRNWFLMDSNELFQPTAPASERIVGADTCMDEYVIRSERQTLRRLDANWALFTIRIQQQTLSALLETAAATQRFAAWVRDVDDDVGRRRHLTSLRRMPLLAALDQHLETEISDPS